MKKAKIILLTVLVMTVVCFSGCTKRAGNPTYEMTIVDNTTSYKIYKHDKTGVYYFAYNGKGVCVMVNADGTPYTGGVNEMDFYDTYKTFEELDKKTLTERFDMFLLLFLFATSEHPKTILSIAKINLPQIMRDSMYAIAGYYEE